MRFLILTLFFPFYCLAGESDEALRKAAEAVSKTEIGKRYIKKAEKIAYRILPVNRDVAASIGTTAMIFAGGGITTKPLKNLNVDLMEGKLRPDLEYKFGSGEVSGNLKINWEW